MPAAADKELKKLISESAIKDSLVPVIICDEKFKVCMKSTGAAKLIQKPSVGSSVLTHMPKNTAEKISVSLPHSTFFETPAGELFTIITEGTVYGRKYYALIFEPRISVLPAEVPRYITASYRHLSDAVSELLTTPSANASKLEYSVTAMLRLTDFFEKTGLATLSAKSGFTDICAELEAVVREYSEFLSTVGAVINFRKPSDRSLLAVYPAEVIQIFASVLTAAALIISSDGHLDIACALSPKSDSMARISIDLTADDTISDVGTFHELATRIVPLCLELAAIEDMAERYNFKLDCALSDGKLNITCDIGIRSPASIKLHAPIRHITPSHLRRIVTELSYIVASARIITKL